MDGTKSTPKPAPIGRTHRYFGDGLGQFAIGQRAILLQTPDGNVLWDLISLIDQPLREFIERLGGLDAIVISHPHFYTTYVEWADRFSCPVYMAADDQEWLCRKPSDSTTIKLIEEASETILPGVTAIKAGGHFPGSLLLHWDDQLFIADTIMTVPVSYSFQWSIPNMIPLGLDEITHIWDAIRPYDFHTTYGAFHGMTVRDRELKRRVFDSMVIQLSREGVEMIASNY
ncbi:MAG: hypothetical protein LQ345_002815 [Seirophora villosa]|nr:MAG: hypothetical protein LQ345_002815 [Seirophora villosa]